MIRSQPARVTIASETATARGIVADLDEMLDPGVEPLEVLPDQDDVDWS